MWAGKPSACSEVSDVHSVKTVTGRCHREFHRCSPGLLVGLRREGRQAVCAAWDESLLRTGADQASAHTQPSSDLVHLHPSCRLSLPRATGANGVLRLCCWERPCALEGQQGQLEWPSGSCRHSCLCWCLTWAQGWAAWAALSCVGTCTALQ